MSDRTQWLGWIERLALPVITAMASGQLSVSLPPVPGRENRTPFAACEAFCRTFVGLAPWLGSTPRPATPEARLHDRCREDTLAALAIGADPDAADAFPFSIKGQPLVEAAFLAHGLLRAPSIFAALDGETQRRLLERLRKSRATAPPACNWLLFSATVEAFFASVGETYDPMRIDYAVHQHDQWYLGDGVYGDGPSFHADYYNSFVIQPMLLDILTTLQGVTGSTHPMTARAAARFVRHAALQERLISPEGTYPPLGRSLAYRFGAFQLLAQAALQHRLPKELRPAQVREALACVIQRSLAAPGTFTDDGWLNVGLAGHQPRLGEPYISRGSVYLCCAVFLPLGLPDDDPFWADPPADWTARRLWNGQDLPADHAYDES